MAITRADITVTSPETGATAEYSNVIYEVAGDTVFIYLDLEGRSIRPKFWQCNIRPRPTKSD